MLKSSTILLKWSNILWLKSSTILYKRTTQIDPVEVSGYGSDILIITFDQEVLLCSYSWNFTHYHSSFYHRYTYMLYNYYLHTYVSIKIRKSHCNNSRHAFYVIKMCCYSVTIAITLPLWVALNRAV